MKHQYPFAEAVSAHFKTGAIRRERVLAGRPGVSVVGCWIVHIVFAIIQDQFEAKMLVFRFFRGILRSIKEVRILIILEIISHLVAVSDAFQMPIDKRRVFVEAIFLKYIVLNTFQIFCLVGIPDPGTFVVKSKFGQPLKYF